MSWVIWILAIAGVLLVAAVANGFLAPLKVHFRTQLPAHSFGHDAAPDGPFVGLALSGGGARAAAFSAAGMQALHKRGLLQGVTHVSSVSGGGFAASYLALNPVPSGAEADGYFAQMQRVMGHDFFWDTQMGQIRAPHRLFSPSRRLCSLQAALERPDFLNGAHFSDLPQDRTFFFNAVSYDTGQRFAFTNGTLPPPDGGDEPLLPAQLRSLSFSDAAARRTTPDAFPLSLAVATSAAFPPYLGPMTIQVDTDAGQPKEYWHLGDGGVLENPGVETLREAAYAQKGKIKGTIYAFDAGKQLDHDMSKNTADISIWSKDVTRLVDVLSTYAATQRRALYEELDARTGAQIELIEFNYMEVAQLAAQGQMTDPKWLSWDGWKEALPQDRQQSATPAEHLAKIPTALKITPCNQELITAAAEFLVEQRFPVNG